MIYPKVSLYEARSWPLPTFGSWRTSEPEIVSQIERLNASRSEFDASSLTPAMRDGIVAHMNEGRDVTRGRWPDDLFLVARLARLLPCRTERRQPGLAGGVTQKDCRADRDCEFQRVDRCEPSLTTSTTSAGRAVFRPGGRTMLRRRRDAGIPTACPRRWKARGRARSRGS